MNKTQVGCPENDHVRRNCGRLSFELATVSDDPNLRQLLSGIRMEGSISVSFRREPNYFTAQACEGDLVQTIVARDNETHQIVGMGSRSLRKLYVNGVLESLGYLSGLRIHSDYRNGTMLARGYRYLRKLDQDQKAAYYLTTIAAENRPALNALLGARGGLPRYERIGSYVTWIVPRKKSHRRKITDPLIRPIAESDAASVLRLIEHCSRSREFIPQYVEGDFHFPSPRFPGLRSNDLKGLWVNGELVAILGMWDQRAMKQVIVERYNGWIQWIRPLYNGWASLAGRPRFPKSGQCLPLVASVLPLATHRGQMLFGDLVDEVASELPKDADAMMIGLSEKDPLTEPVRKRAIQDYKTDIYLVAWDELRIPTDLGNDLIPYLELGTL
jgi:hypothetical protein